MYISTGNIAQQVTDRAYIAIDNKTKIVFDLSNSIFTFGLG